ncbi:MAG: amidohydrolase family protein [Armatimonas sp.]
MTDLAAFISESPLADTHEHLQTEAEFLASGPDVLGDLFDHYVTADLAVAGASSEALKRLHDRSDLDLAGRFLGIRDAWELVKHTGYGEGVRLTAKRVYGLDEIVPEALAVAQKIAESQRQPGERKRLLKDVANLSYVQIDDFRYECEGDEFFQYDINVMSLVQGNIPDDLGPILNVTHHIRSVFDKWAPKAIAVKTQHAYARTLRWKKQSDSDIANVLSKGKSYTPEDKLAIGDWAFARCIEAAIEHNLPIKIHTGYYAGHSNMGLEKISAALLCDLLREYPKATFILMHTSYPYTEEVIALAKHYPNVFLDLCWAWSINPYTTSDFVRRVTHSVPANKLLAFGGDSFWPNAAVSYAFQARTWLTRALQAEVDDQFMTEKEAIILAKRWMGGNQEALFDFAKLRS